MGRLVPVLLVLAGAYADRIDDPGFAFYVTLVAVPFAAAALLAGIGDERADRLQTTLSGLALLMIVIGSAARAPAVAEGVVPPLAQTALVACLLLFVAQAVVALRRELEGQ
jgi:small ligand-binding sensory domain FIST